MASAAHPAGGAEQGLASLPADALSYEDLYARWERGNWSATELDFTEDARQWREDFTDFERRAAIWNYCLFFWGEDAVADNLSPFIDAAPREEQKYFLATQQVDEARHAVLFRRFMHEVCGIGDGSAASGLAAIEPQLTPGFRRVFGRLDEVAAELRRDPSRARLAAAVTLYHVVIEASLAQPGQHFICGYLEARDKLPAFRAGMENVAADEQRHIGFGVKLLADLAREDPRGVPRAVARTLREVSPFTSQVLMPPGWDESYVSVFDSSFDEVGTEGVQSMASKLRSAGLAVETLPGPPVLPRGLTPLEISRRGRRLAQAGVIGVREGPTSRDPEIQELLFDTIGRQTDTRAAAGSTGVEWSFSDGDVGPWHIVAESGSARSGPGPLERPDVRVRVSWQDWVDIVGARLSPVRALATGRMRLRGGPFALARMRRLFPAT